MSILDRLLKKRGIENLDSLSGEERAVYENYKAVLSKETLTIEDFKEYCQSQVDLIEGKWNDYGLPNEKKAELLPYFSVYKAILKVIDSPRSAREGLEKHLNQLLNQ